MNTLQLSFYAVAIGVCAFTGLLAWRASFKNPYFLAFLATLVVIFNCDWLMHHPDTPLKNLWLLLLMGSTFLVSPCVLLLTKSVAAHNLDIRWRLHAGCVVLGWLLLIPLGTAIHWGTGFVNTVTPISSIYALFIHTTMLAAVGIFLLQTGLALSSGWSLLKQRSQQNRVLFSEQADPGLNILRVLLLTVITNAAVCIVKVLYCALLDDTYIALNLAITGAQLAMVVYLALAFIKQVVNPADGSEVLRNRLFDNTPNNETSVPLKPSNNTALEEKDAALKYEKSSLPQERHDAILHKIEQALDTDHLYRQPGLSLRDLCEHLQETPHHVSQVINGSELQNFYDMVNQRRVAMALRLLQQKKSLSVLDIAFECGFNSKSSFNSVFKRVTDMTPSQARAQSHRADVQSMSNAVGLDDI